MGHTIRRALPVFLVFALTLVIIGRPDVTPSVRAAATENFTKVAPARLLAGDISHGGLANAHALAAVGPNPAVPLNGYCVQLNAGSHLASGLNRGFALVAGAPIDPAVPVTTQPTILSTDYYDNGTVTTADDTYCIVITAPVGAADVTINWSYTDASSAGGIAVATLYIPVVTVTLRGVDGVVGGAGLICTVTKAPGPLVGFNQGFLTGHTSNLSGTLPDPIDKVGPQLSPPLLATDWVLSPVVGTLTILGSAYRDPDVTNHPGEWCISVGSTVAQANVNVVFSFDSVYDRTTNADDRPQAGDGTQPRHVVSLAVPIKFDLVNYSELRFVATNGQLTTLQQSPLMIIGSTALACVIPSDALDLLSPNNIIFGNGTGPDIPNVTEVHVFHHPGGAGVVAGTLCFTWISTSPGEQSITLTFWKHNPIPVIASTTLTAPINLATDTTMTVTSSAGFSVGQPILIDSEVMVITAIAGNVISVQRGASGTGAAPVPPNLPPGHAAGATVTAHGSRVVAWDSNGDGNGFPAQRNGPLIARWAKVQETRITQGHDPNTGIVTNTTQPLPVDFNLGGSFQVQSATLLTEWVYGVERTGTRTVVDLAQGAVIRARIESSCGLFSVSGSKTANGVSTGGGDLGRLDLTPVTSLAVALTIGATKMVVIDSAGFFVGQFVQIENEEVMVVAINANTIDIVRATQGSFAAAHAVGTLIGQLPDGVADDIDFTILPPVGAAPACGMNSSINLKIDVFTPLDLTKPATTQEFVNYSIQFITPQSTPIVAWAGQTVTIAYAFSFSGSCGLAGSRANFTRYDGQPGSFVPSPEVTLNGAGNARAAFSGQCQATVQYSSPDPGEVDVVAMIGCTPTTVLTVAMSAIDSTMTVADASRWSVGEVVRVDNEFVVIGAPLAVGTNTVNITRAANGSLAAAHAIGAIVGASCIDSLNFSKVVFPIFFMDLEDLKITATASSVVSTPGGVSARVRGWFVGTNPSPRPAETKPDGRVLPAKRWIIPDDWEQLRGFADARTNWPSQPDMPPLVVTFGMANESIVNSYADKVSTGDLGWMYPDNGTEFSWNTDPLTLDRAKLTPITFNPFWRQPLSASAPITQIPPARILSDYSDFSGLVSLGTFGDFNLSYEGCPQNRLTTTPHPECDEHQVVGHTNYVAWTNLPGPVGKHPPLRSATATTEWQWAGYKKLEVIDTASSVLKYVVVHLKDRDGFCDGAYFNNVLGLPIEFQILGRGDGKIAAMGGSNAVLGSDRQTATVTTFDTVDYLGQPLHADITMPVREDGECQAWIKVSQSLPNPLRVRVTIPATPAPVPALGSIRISQVVCYKPLEESVTLKNYGAKAVSLEGFSLRSDPDRYLAPEEYMEPTGILLPGESRTYQTNQWLNLRQDYTVFREDKDPNDDMDYARLMWGGTEVSRAWCDGRIENPDPLSTVVPSGQNPSGEGDLTYEIVLPFGEQAEVQLLEGWNLVSATDGLDISNLVKGHESDLAAIYSWDDNGNWLSYIVNAPANTNTLTRVESGKSMWLQVKQPFTLSMLK